MSFLSFWAIFCHLTLLTTQNIKILKKMKKSLEILSFSTCVSQMTIIYYMALEIWSTTDIFFLILDQFLPFSCANYPKYQNFGKIKKAPGDIIILHGCTRNDNHMMYGSWDMEHDRQNFLSFWTIFCPFTIVHNGVPAPLFKAPTSWPSVHPPFKNLCFPFPLFCSTPF